MLAVLTLLAAVYVGGYVLVRGKHYLVHYGSRDAHSVRIGDVGFRFPGMNPHYDVARFSYYAFTPLRWLETGCWQLIGRTQDDGPNHPRP